MCSILKPTFLTALTVASFFDCSIAQKFLALDVYHVTGNMKRIRFYTNNEIIYRKNGSRIVYSGAIMEITDTSFTIEKKEPVYIKDIKSIIIDRSNFVTRAIPEFLMAFGGSLIVLDTFNNLVNGDSPVVKKGILTEGLAFASGGWVLLRFAKKKYRMGKRRVLKVIDVTP